MMLHAQPHSRSFFHNFLAVFIAISSLQTLAHSDTEENEPSFLQLNRGVCSSRGYDPSRVTQLSWTPRVFLYKGFLSDEECDHLISLGTGGLKKSRIVDDDGNSVQSKFRTSSGSFLALSQDEMVADIEKRIATWTFLPPENGESMQILRYELHEYYVLHRDYYTSAMKMTRTLKGGNRLATVLMYLSNVTKGGETIFPQAQGYLPRDDVGDLSECAKEKGGLSVKPFKGDALLFFNLHPNATGDPRTLHGSCPVVEGEKWVATKWIRVRGNDSDACEEDANEECPELAARGECEKNPFYMVGFNGTAGHCMKSCRACGDGESSSS